MGFLNRLLSVGKSKRKDGKHNKSKKNAEPLGNSQLLPISQDQEAVVNRLLRSSSTHFSILSETEYRSMPPIPHPINNILRAPSIISNATQTDTYTVTVHRRMLHSRTEFPNANRSGSSSKSNSPTRRHSLPPLTPGDKNRLSRLRQDTSVLSLLNIYDEGGHPDPQAFSNTPARQGRDDASLRALLGNPSAPSLTTSRTSVEESDISWAERYIRTARRDSTSSTATTSSLGIPVNLFRRSISLERLRFDPYDTASSSNDMDVGIDSLQVERGTVEDTSMVFQAPTTELTSPTRRASQFFKFLSERESSKTNNHPSLPALPAVVTAESRDSLPPTLNPCKSVPPSPRASRSTYVPTSSPVDLAPPLNTMDTPVLFIRDGPKENHAHVSPPPRRRLHPLPSPIPPVPTQYQSLSIKPSRLKPISLGRRLPLDEVRNADGDELLTASRSVSARSVSIASSVHPHIETQEPNSNPDLYTPVPPRRMTQRKGDRHAMTGENVPPNAPARPVRGQPRRHVSREPGRSKENSASVSKIALNEQITLVSVIPSKREHYPHVPPKVTLPTTPSNNPTLSHLRTPSRPSPASSSELSPEGREIMASARAKARKLNSGSTPRAWQSWTGIADPSKD